LGNVTAADGILQCGSYMCLSDNRVEGLRAVFAGGYDEVFHENLLNTIPITIGSTNVRI
jgi:hypothetical protein